MCQWGSAQCHIKYRKDQILFKGHINFSAFFGYGTWALNQMYNLDQKKGVFSPGILEGNESNIKDEYSYQFPLKLGFRSFKKDCLL